MGRICWGSLNGKNIRHDMFEDSGSNPDPGVPLSCSCCSESIYNKLSILLSLLFIYITLYFKYLITGIITVLTLEIGKNRSTSLLEK